MINEPPSAMVEECYLCFAGLGLRFLALESWLASKNALFIMWNIFK
jgi:hypothetical protein